MSLESFYGGRQGVSPVIKNRFEYIDVQDPAYQVALAAAAGDSNKIQQINQKTMDLCFLDSTYENVWYNELCIIDTTNKNNPNNGKLFRRTLKGAGDTGVNRTAEYIGQIVGATSGTPFMSFNSINEVNDKIHENYTINENTAIAWPANAENISTTKPAANVNPYQFEASVDNNMLVPGKMANGNFNDNIVYTWFNIRNDTKASPMESWVYLGLQIPYPSIDIETSTVNWTMNALATKIDDGQHPFYHKWQLSLPRGVKGNAAGNIRLAQCKDFQNLAPSSIEESIRLLLPKLCDFEKSVVDNLGAITVTPIIPDDFAEWTDTDKENNKDNYIFVYDYTIYNKNSSNNQNQQIEYTFYIGKYEEIKNITMEDGIIKIDYGYKNSTSFSAIRGIENIEIKSDGEIVFTYNTKTNNVNDVYSTYLPFPTQFIINKQGEITLELQGAEEDDVIQKPLRTRWIDPGYTLVPYVLDDDRNPSLEHWYERDINTDRYFQSTDTVRNLNKNYYYYNRVIDESFQFNYVKNFQMNNQTKALSYTTYPNEETVTTLNNGIGLNYLQGLALDPVTHHVLAFNASSQFRPSAAEVTEYENLNPGDSYTGKISDTWYDENNIHYVIWNNQTFRNSFEYNDISGDEYWLDLGGMFQNVYGTKVMAGFSFNSYDSALYTPQTQNQEEVMTYSVSQFLSDVLNASNWGEFFTITGNTVTPCPNAYKNGAIPGTDNNGTSLRGWMLYANIDGGTLYYYNYSDNQWEQASGWRENAEIVG